MDYVKPAAVAQAMFEAGKTKLAIAPRDLFIRGMLSGAILGVATSLAFTGAVTTGQPIVGAIIFPVGLVSIVLLGLELVTGSFALLPLPSAIRGPGVLSRGVRPAPLGSSSATSWAAWIGGFLHRHRPHQHVGDRSPPASPSVSCRSRRGQATTRLRRLAPAGWITTAFVKATPVQLDGLPCSRAGDDHDLDGRQGCHGLAADLHILRPGLRAHRRQHVHHSHRHDAGRQSDHLRTSSPAT